MSVDNSYYALNAEKSSFTLNAEKLHFSPGTSTAHHQTGAPLQSRCAFVIIGVTQTECVQNAQLIQVLENTAVSVITDWLAFGNEQAIIYMEELQVALPTFFAGNSGLEVYSRIYIMGVDC